MQDEPNLSHSQSQNACGRHCQGATQVYIKGQDGIAKMIALPAYDKTSENLYVNEPRHEKHFPYAITNVTAKLISAFDFTSRIVKSLYFLNRKFPVSSHF